MISSGSSSYSHILWLSLRSGSHSPTLPLDSWNPAKHVHWVTSQKSFCIIYSIFQFGCFLKPKGWCFLIGTLYYPFSTQTGRSRYIIQICLVVFQTHLEIQWTPGIPYSICICLIPKPYFQLLAQEFSTDGVGFDREVTTVVEGYFVSIVHEVPLVNIVSGNLTCLHASSLGYF